MKCAQCQSDAVGTCSYCGQFYCLKHGTKWDRIGAMQGKWLCDSCMSLFEKNQAFLLPMVFAALAIGVGAFALLLWRR